MVDDGALSSVSPASALCALAARAACDPAALADLLKAPKAAAEAAGASLGPDVEVVVLVNSESSIHFVVPCEDVDAWPGLAHQAVSPPVRAALDRARREDALKRRLIANPGALSEYGLSQDDVARARVCVDTAQRRHIVVPARGAVVESRDNKQTVLSPIVRLLLRKKGQPE